MNESRSNLATIYTFDANKIDAVYADGNKILIEKQILLAGLRLAAVLQHNFNHLNRTPVFTKENTIIPTISIDSIAAYENKMVKVCTKVYGTKFLSDSKGQPTFLNAGAAFPNALLTILIWGNNREHFKNHPEKYYDQKNICVTGNIIMYKGKPEIVVSKEEEIEVQ
jgi:micrococcal nuclease